MKHKIGPVFFDECDCGSSTYLCQECGKIKCDAENPSTWKTLKRSNKLNGNVCPDCIKKG